MHIVNCVIIINCVAHKQIVLFVFCSDELKELEAKLRAGYVNRERAAQLAEKQAERMLERVQCVQHFIPSTNVPACIPIAT